MLLSTAWGSCTVSARVCPRTMLWPQSGGASGGAANPQAQASLGIAYHTGTGVKKDDVEAAKWYRKAAEQGISIAQFDLGVMYYRGEGVRKDDAEAVRWYRQSC